VGNPLIWFDDGYESTFLVAYPMMKEVGLTGIVAVVTGIVGKLTGLGRRSPTQFMTKEQLSMLVDDGWEIASHSVTHPFRFAELSFEQIHWELSESKRWITENLGVKPEKFAVPRHRIRKEQVELVMKYYNYMRPLRKGTIFHEVKRGKSFQSYIKKVVKKK